MKSMSASTSSERLAYRSVDPRLRSHRQYDLGIELIILLLIAAAGLRLFLQILHVYAFIFQARQPKLQRPADQFIAFAAIPLRSGTDAS